MRDVRAAYRRFFKVNGYTKLRKDGGCFLSIVVVVDCRGLWVPSVAVKKMIKGEQNVIHRATISSTLGFESAVQHTVDLLRKCFNHK
jgi:hypothetical protein